MPRSASPTRRGTSARQAQALRRAAAANLPDARTYPRNPGALIELLIDLLPLRQTFAARNVAPPPIAVECDRPHDADAALLPHG